MKEPHNQTIHIKDLIHPNSEQSVSGTKTRDLEVWNVKDTNRIRNTKEYITKVMLFTHLQRKKWKCTSCLISN